MNTLCILHFVYHFSTFNAQLDVEKKMAIQEDLEQDISNSIPPPILLGTSMPVIHSST